MDEKLVEFSNLLRQNGLRVSLAESMDVFRALDVVGIADRETMRAALRATLVKRSVDVPTYEQLFDLFFSGLADAIREVTAATATDMEMADPDFQQFLDDLAKLLAEAGIELTPLARALLSGDTGTLERLIREAAARARLDDIQQGFQEGRFAHGIATELDMAGVAGELARMREQLQAAGASNPRLERFFDRRLQDLAEMVKAA